MPLDFAAIADRALTQARPAKRRTDYSALHEGAAKLHSQGWSVQAIVDLIRREMPDWQQKATEDQIYSAIARYLRNHAKD